MSWGTQSNRIGGDGANALPGGVRVHLALYKYDSCPYCRVVFRAIDAVGASVEYRDVLQDRRWRSELYERTGRTTVPCLLIDGEPLFESADIAAWLRKQFAHQDTA